LGAASRSAVPFGDVSSTDASQPCTHCLFLQYVLI
jgi:hypothetical protein